MPVINPQAHDFRDISLAVEPFNLLADNYGQDLAVKQLQLEHEAYAEGEKRFIKNMQRQIDNGEGSDNAVAKPLLATLLPLVSAGFTQWVIDNKPTNRPRVAMTLLTGGKDNDWQPVIKPDTFAAIALKTIISRLTKSDTCTMQAVTSAIGRNVEDEMRFGRIRDQEAEHFKKYVAQNLKKRAGQTYKKAYMNAVETHMLEQAQLADAWGTWSNRDANNVGIAALEVVMLSTGLVEQVRENAGDAAKDITFIRLAPAFVESLGKRAYNLAGIAPVYQPCVVPPKPWTGIVGGGYWAKGRRPLSMLRLANRAAVERYEHVHMPEVFEAVNVIQNTAWKINKKVLEVVNAMCAMDNPHDKSGIPSTDKLKPESYTGDEGNEVEFKSWKRYAAGVYRKEKARQSRRLSADFMVEQANKFSQFKAIWFPMNLDWRGRVYAVPMFNPQGNDMVKGLLTLAKGKAIGAEGFKWLKIHGANTAGIDKELFEDRIQWVEDNADAIMQTAANPLDMTDFWCKKDSPFCFLAFCFEYAAVVKHGLSYVSSLPLAFDGSCSGIQHFSAMLRDHIGGHAVNLTNSGKVQDIYRLVVLEVKKLLDEDVVSGTDRWMKEVKDKKTKEVKEISQLGTKEAARQWLEFMGNMDESKWRGITKRSVMTLAYGSKEYGFADQVFEDTVMPAVDSGDGAMFSDPSQASRYMANLIWRAVSVTVVAAVEAMKWLQTAAKLLAQDVKVNGELVKPALPVYWVTPDGYPVWQEYRVREVESIDLLFMGDVRIQLQINSGKDKKIDKRKQESGISPNYVHSMDGNHLRMTAVHAHRKYGIESFAMIHDSFGTIAADAGNLFMAIRESMVSIYESNDVLEDFRQQFMLQLHESQLEEMPEIPKRGKLDLQEILKSQFAFA